MSGPRSPKNRAALDAMIDAALDADDEREQRRDQERGAAEAHGGTRESVLATARSRAGNPLAASEITPETIVTLPGGMQVEARTAERAGFLVRNPQTGAYADPFDVPAGSNAKPSQASGKEGEREADKGADEDNGVALDDATERTLGRMLDVTPTGEQIAAVEAVINGDEIPEAVYGRLAERMGITEDEAVTAFAHVHLQMKAQADSVTGDSGLDPEDVYEWGWEHKPEKMKAALRTHTRERSLSGYAALRDEYLSKLDVIDPELAGASLDASGTPYRIHNGQIVIRTAIGEISWREAARQGFFRFSKR